MKYSPGSFTKNFAWHQGQGFSKLHTAIRIAFPALASVPIDDWLEDPSGQLKTKGGVSNRDQRLVPQRFFFHNLNEQLSVDELIYQALFFEHSRRFDHLCLFAFHLNHCGPSAPAERPAKWANEFVREDLWQSGGWVRERLAEDQLQASLDGRLEAVPDTRKKCRTNYHYFFELAGYVPGTSSYINTSASEWLGPALFLAWDRCLLAGKGYLEKDALLDYANYEELYKLAGISADSFDQLAPSVADLYVSAGGVERFVSATHSGTSGTASPTEPVTSGTALSSGLEWLTRQYSDEAIERNDRLRSEQTRNRKLASEMKEFYGNRCCLCGKLLQVGIDPDIYYSEASHIRPLGKPHDGPDKPDNIAVFCRDHHLQFDRGLLRLKKKKGTYRTYIIHSKLPADPLGGKEVELQHELDQSCVEYHFAWFAP